MYELIQTGEKSYYINCPAKIGIYKPDDTNVFLIDSGNDKDAGKKVKKLLDANNWTLKGIINTHSNADHIGGNKYLQTQTGCTVFSRGIEKAFTEYPVLEPSFLYGGYPPKALCHKFLLAESSIVTDISSELFPNELEVIDLPGHFFDMIGIRTPDDTVFIADSLCSKSTLDKYAVTFIYDVESYLNTLDMLSNMQARLFVPSHADAAEDISDLICYNKNKIYEVADKITELLKSPMNFDELLKSVFDTYKLKMSFEQYALVGCTVRSYLAWLTDCGRIIAEIDNNMLIWKA